MNSSRKKLLIAMQVCLTGLATLIVTAPASAQTTATVSASPNPNGGLPLFTVTHDATLNGNGTSGSPLGISPSPTLSGSLTVNGDIQAKNIVSVNSTVTGDLTVNSGIQTHEIVDDTVTADGIFAHTVQVRAVDAKITDAIVASGSSFHGTGVDGVGGEGSISNGARIPGGIGVTGEGGNSDTGQGGVGVHGKGNTGGSEFNVTGGIGVEAEGGNRLIDSGLGGVGLMAKGGFSINGNGGAGLSAIGGSGRFDGFHGGTGILSIGGTGNSGAKDGLGAEFDGDVRVSGSLLKGGGSFKIDHPLDPANKYLSHSFVESPDMMNIYNGNVRTDSHGDALVQLPEYFEALNRDFRYQLTVIGAPADGIVAEEINDNHFRIKTSLPGIEVSWQVTGIRQDAEANRNRIAVEEDKPRNERGFYLHPEAFGQTLERSILMAQQPELVRQLQAKSPKAEKDGLRQK